jgi:hypothetical protein
MGVAYTGESELVRIAAVDYFTGETLLDALVFPQVKMWHLNSKYSGVNWPLLYKAREMGKTIPGHHAARRRIWDFVGPETIVVVHSGHQDFTSLRWLHKNVIDTLNCESRLLEPQ